MYANIERQGLFQHPKRHHKFNDVMTSSEVTHAKSKNAKALKEVLHEIIVEERYLSEHIVSVDEASLL